MLKRLRSQAAGLTGVLLVSLLLAACGVQTGATPAETAAKTPAPAETVTPAAAKETPTEATVAKVTPTEELTATQVSSATATAPKEAVCQPVQIPTDDKIAPPSDKDWTKGPATAPVTLIEYADFQCPGCAGISPVAEKLKADYGDEMRFIYRHFPLIGIHDKAQITAEAAEAAGAQGKFWEMHDLLFARQQDWSAKSVTETTKVLADYAQEVGVPDLEKFKSDLEKGTYTAKVKADYEAATKIGLPGTPSFVINQVNYPSDSFGLSYNGLDTFIKLMKLTEKWYSQPDKVIDPKKQYIATIKTDQGDIVVELYPDTAPVNVNSFAFLAQKGWYNDTTFHRVLPKFVAQGGDPTGTGVGFPGYRCSDEVTSTRTFDKKGVVSLANSGPNSNGSQFFITYDAIPQLNEGFTIIGQVIEGMEVAEKITPRDPEQTPDAPAGDKILGITVEEKK